LRKAAGNNHQIGLARRRTKNFGAETRHVEARGGHGHHFNGAAGEAESERPNGAFARPVYGLVQLRKDDAFVLKQAAKIVGLDQHDVFA